MATKFARAPDKVPVSFDIPAGEFSVLDGYCHATGSNRTAVMRKLLKDWSDIEHRKAILICRVAGINPPGTEPSQVPPESD